MGGRPPKPIPIKRALGNPGKRRLKYEPPLRKLMPEVAPWLDAASRAFLAKHLPLLMRAGLITEADGPGLSMLADRYAEVLALREMVRQEGLPRSIELGYMNALRRAEDAFRRWAEGYGFTALSRTRLAQEEEGASGQEDARGLDAL